MSKTIKIEGEVNINNIGGFEQYISQFGHKSRICNSNFLCLPNGSFEIHVLTPNIRECEIYAFQNNPIKFYRKELPDGIISTSIRGMTISDFVHKPFSTEIPLNEMEIQDSIIQAFLIDTATDEIKGFRIAKVPKRVVSQIIDDWMTMESHDLSRLDILRSMEKHIFPYTPKEFMKRSLYIGRECEDLTPDFVYFVGKDVA